MAELRTITCGDCGAPYETKRSNAKICARCRLIRDLIFIGDRTRTCWLCNKEYAPLERKDTACADCSYHVQSHGKAECMFCGETKLRVRRDVPVCHHCARNPKHRVKFVGRLRKGQRDRQEIVA